MICRILQVFIVASFFSCIEEEVKPLNSDSLELIETNCTVEIEEEIVCFINPIIQPQFPGGWTSFIDYMDNQINKNSFKGNIKRPLFIRFVVTDSGLVQNAEIIKGNDCQSCADAALNAIEAMPIWTPALQDGIPIKMSMVVPIRF